VGFFPWYSCELLGFLARRSDFDHKIPARIGSAQDTTGTRLEIEEVPEDTRSARLEIEEAQEEYQIRDRRDTAVDQDKS
jgi:hypothetical protein